MISRSETETERIAARFARRVKQGDVIALHGVVGAGKTVFTRGLCRGLGGRTRVTSPTFKLLNILPTRWGPLYHIDGYRLAGAPEFRDAGIEEIVLGGGPAGRGIVGGEWPKGWLRQLRPGPGWTVRFWVAGERRRTITMIRRTV